MAKLGFINNNIAFLCPGCGVVHEIPLRDGCGCEWNGDLERPTLSSSLKVTTASLGTKNDLKDKDFWHRSVIVCNFKITDGKIKFLGDSTHPCVNRTMEIPEWENDKNTDDGKGIVAVN